MKVSQLTMPASALPSRSSDVRALRCNWSVFFAISLCVILQGLFPLSSTAQNPIVLENQQPGSGGWLIQGNTGSDAVGQIRAFMGAASVNKGQSIDFHVSVNPAQTYTIDLYRLGWYQGSGGRLMQHIGPLNGTTQPTCPIDSTTGLIECHWAVGYTLNTQTSWTSGVYLAVLTNAQGFQSYANFILRDDNRVASLLYQVGVNTYQAYNDYPYDQKTGKSLYGFNSYGANTVGGSPAAVKASFDRPYNTDGDCAVWGHCVLALDVDWIHWLEKSGYDVAYTTDVDIHINGAILPNYRGIIIGGHDEYWSKTMYDNFVSALNAGLNLGFFSANSIYWQIRYESSSTGVPNRVIVCYRNAAIDPTTDPTVTTVNWRDPPVNRPEQALIGVMYTNQVSANAQGQYPNFVVNNSSNWVYSGTGFKDGDTVTGLTGYEADRLFSTFPGPNAVSGTYTLLSHSPFQASGTSDYQNSSVYQATSGAWVFGAGTINWALALDSFNLGSATSLVDARIQQTTANILGQFIGNPPPDFTLATSPATQTVAPGGSTTYGVTITPKGTFSGSVNLGVTGLPTGASASFTPDPATSSSTLSVTTSNTTPTGTYTLTVTGVSGALTHTNTVTLAVMNPDFSLSASPTSMTILQGASASYAVNVNSIAGFSGQVTFSVTGLPSGATPSFTPNPATSSSTLSISTSSTTPLGSYTLTITGTSGSLTHTTSVTLVVSTPDFSLSASPASQTVTQGHSTTYTVTVNPILGFGGQVTMAVAGLPTGSSGSFSPNPTATSSTLTVTVGASTPPGTSTLTVTGSSGSLTHTVTVSLNVNPSGVAFDNKVSSNFQFGVTKITTPAFTIGSNSNRAAMIMVAMSANTATSITASLGGVSGTLVPGSDSGTTAAGRTMIFRVINPPSGSQTATVSWTGSMNADVGVITVSGADQTNPVNNGAFFATNSSASASGSLTVTSNSGDLTATIGYTADAWKSPFTNKTLKWGIDSAEVGGDIGGGTGTTTHTWTDTYAFQQLMISGANFRSAATPDFSLSMSPASQSINAGAATSYGVTVADLNGFTGQVNLSVSGLPSGATANFSTNPATTSSTLSVTTSSTTPVGSYTLTVTGTGGGITHSTTVKLIVTTPDFSLAASPTSQNVNPGASTSYGVTITALNGFSSPVALSVTGLPAGANGTFSPNPAVSSSSLSVTSDPALTPPGTYTLTITGTSGSLTHSATVTLVVNTPNFSLTATPASQTTVEGGSVTYNVTINPVNGFGGQVSLSVSGTPTGTSGNFTTNPATSSSSLNVTVGASTPGGTYTLTITGTSGSLTHTTTVSLTVTAPDFTLSSSPSTQTVVQGSSTSYATTINAVNGFSGQVTFSVSGLPAGANGTFSPNPGTSSSTLSVTTDATATPAGSYTLTITGTSGTLSHTTTVQLVVTAPDFTLSASPTSQNVVEGSGVTYGVTVTALNGFTGSVNLTVTGAPTGANGTFNPNPAATSSNLSVTTATTTPTGTYTLTITGTSGSLTHTTSVTLVVKPIPDFTLTASPANQSVVSGGSTNYTTTIGALNGFTGQVTLAVSGLPTGANGSFSPNPATTTSTLAVTTTTSTPIGSYTVTITGTSGSLVHTATVTLAITSPPPPGVKFDNHVSSGYNWGVTSITTPAFVIGTNSNRAAMIMVVMDINNATNVTASLGGVAGTLIPGTDSGTSSGLRTMIFQVINPPSGSQSATVSWTGTADADVGVITVSGAKQTSPTNNGTFRSVAVESGAATSITISSNPGDLTASVAATDGVWTSPFTNQIKEWGIDSGASGGDIGPGTGTTTHAWTDTYIGQTHAVSGANFVSQ